MLSRGQTLGTSCRYCAADTGDKSASQGEMQQKRGGRDGPQESVISVGGSLGPDPSLLLKMLMASVQDRISINLQEVTGGALASAGDWVMDISPETDRPSGKIRVQLPSSGIARELERAAHNQVVAVGGDHVPIQVSNFKIMELPGGQGNATEAPVALPGSPPGL